MKKFFAGGYIFLVLAFIYAPIFLLVVYSFTDSTIVGVWNGFSVDLYAQLFSNDKLRDTIVGTAVLALLAGVISTILGTLGAIGIFYSKKIMGKVVSSASQITVINAEIVTAISLALVFSLLSFGKSYAALIIGHVAICTPFVILSVIPRLKQMDPSLYEAAIDLGATPTQALFKVIIPEIMPAIFSGFMLAITMSLDDYMVSAFTKPSTFNTISTYAFSAVRNQKNSDLPALRALSAVIFIIIVVVVVCMNIKASKENKKAKLMFSKKI